MESIWWKVRSEWAKVWWKKKKKKKGTLRQDMDEGECLMIKRKKGEKMIEKMIRRKCRGRNVREKNKEKKNRRK